MYNYNDIQSMIDRVNNDDKVSEIASLVSEHDRQSVLRVLRLGCAEDFDRYDSDVCEQFITAYEKLFKLQEGA